MRGYENDASPRISAYPFQIRPVNGFGAGGSSRQRWVRPREKLDYGPAIPRRLTAEQGPESVTLLQQAPVPDGDSPAPSTSTLRTGRTPDGRDEARTRCKPLLTSGKLAEPIVADSLGGN